MLHLIIVDLDQTLRLSVLVSGLIVVSLPVLQQVLSNWMHALHIELLMTQYMMCNKGISGIGNHEWQKAQHEIRDEKLRLSLCLFDSSTTSLQKQQQQLQLHHNKSCQHCGTQKV